jgi:hypothetical protein
MFVTVGKEEKGGAPPRAFRKVRCWSVSGGALALVCEDLTADGPRLGKLVLPWMSLSIPM